MFKLVLDLAHEFMEEPAHVAVNDDGIEKYCQKIEKEIPEEPYFIGAPEIPLFDDELEQMKQIVLYELLASSVNYKYWYGKYDVRPHGSSANHMYKMLDDAFKEGLLPSSGTVTHAYVEQVIHRFTNNLLHERFPMSRERAEHLKEMMHDNQAYTFIGEVAFCIAEGHKGMTYLLERLVINFPGFAEDIFLKRAFLFFMMLFRRMEWFKHEIHELPIPADYQIPKILQKEGCLVYSSKLYNDIQEGKLIPKGSRRECEIRAASIVACEKIAKQCNVPMCFIDDYIWMNRKEYDIPFHLTVTTDY